MKVYQPRKSIRSKGVFSPLAPHAVWKLEVYPNGNFNSSGGYVSIHTTLTGSMVSVSLTCWRAKVITMRIKADKKRTLDGVGISVYILNEATGEKEYIRYTDCKYESGSYSKEMWTEDHDQVRESLHTDGSLAVGCDLEFFLPTAEDEQNPLGGNAISEAELRTVRDAALGKLLSSGNGSDCTIVVGSHAWIFINVREYKWISGWRAGVQGPPQYPQCPLGVFRDNVQQ